MRYLFIKVSFPEKDVSPDKLKSLEKSVSLDRETRSIQLKGADVGKFIDLVLKYLE